MGKENPNNHATRFQKGVSGNPAGRPKGIVSKREWFELHVPEERRVQLLNIAFTKALEGKSEMIEFLLARIVPPAPTDDTIDIKLTQKTHRERGDEIFAALEEKRITPSQAHMLFATLCDNVKLVEMTEIVERIKRLEASQKLT